MKYIIILALAIFTNHSSAVVIWPDTVAPCNATLTACADAIPRGEVIEIRTNGPIEQSLTTNNGISVVAGMGYKPVFAAGHGLDISGTSHGELVITISGLTFIRGRISYNARGAPDTSTKLNITNNHIIVNSNEDSSIRINNFFDQSLDINIAYNQVTYNSTNTGLERSGAISISNGLNFGLPLSLAELTGRIYNNQIKSVGEESVGIGLYEISESTSDIDISSNKIIGGETAAVYIEKSTGSTGTSKIDFAHNATYSNQIDDNYRGFMAEVAAGELEIKAINNTITNAFDGFNFQETASGVLDVELYNNIVANSGAPVILNFYNLSDSTIELANNNNLFFDNQIADPDYIPGASFISTNPLFKSPTNARLSVGSPAIEAGNSFILLAISSVPFVDADGLNRIKKGDSSPSGASVDIGAYETGDLRKLDIFKNTDTYTNTIESQTINLQTNPNLQVTPNWNPLSSSGIYNNSNFGVFKFGFAWHIFNQDFVEMIPDTAFNVWSPAQSSSSFVHIATDAFGGAESSTLLTSGGTMNNPNAILAVTQRWDSKAGSVYNDNPVGAFYDTFLNQWRINNTNLVDMPLDAQFNVYYQTASANAFVHQAVTENTFVSITYIDHPLLNDSPCAQIQVTHVGLTINPFPTGVYYEETTGQWGIFNQSGDPMANNAKFHVILSPEQIAECGDIIFANDFE